jgi:hypothetical protein
MYVRSALRIATVTPSHVLFDRVRPRPRGWAGSHQEGLGSGDDARSLHLISMLTCSTPHHQSDSLPLLLIHTTAHTRSIVHPTTLMLDTDVHVLHRPAPHHTTLLNCLLTTYQPQKGNVGVHELTVARKRRPCTIPSHRP